jgi:hypothetical protein
MPAATGSRGGLMLVRADGAATTSASFGMSGEATYALSLWPGVYDVRLSANPTLCAVGLPAPAVPCVGGLLRAAASLQADGALDVDVPAVTVRGNVTLAGRPLPPETLDRGRITFARVAGEGGDAASFSLGPSAAATYAMTVTGGAYLVSHVANSALCAPGRTLPGVPCASQVAGCRAR